MIRGWRICTGRMMSEQVAYYLRWTLEFFIRHRFVTDLHQMVDSALSLNVSPGNWQIAFACQSRPKVDVQMQERNYRVTDIPDCSDVVDVAYTPSSAAVASACFAWPYFVRVASLVVIRPASSKLPTNTNSPPRGHLFSRILAPISYRASAKHRR